MPATIMLKGQVLHLALRFACKVFRFTNDPRSALSQQWLQEADKRRTIKDFFAASRLQRLPKRGVIAVAARLSCL